LKVDGIDDKAWDFAKVPEKEIPACFHYEFARESKRLVEAIDTIRHKFAIKSFDDFLPYRVLFPPGKGLEFFIAYPNWPAAYYLEIDPAIRNERIKLLSIEEITDQSLARRLEGPRYPLSKLPEIKLVIPPYFNHRELLEAFAAVLRLRFPAQSKIKPQGAAGGTRPERDALTSLAVHRLRKHGEKSSYIAAILKNAKGQLVYKSETAVNRAYAKAKKRIRSFEASVLRELRLSAIS
jgi:hypothetical protein